VTIHLVDCRPRETYEAGHLPDAVHLDPETDLSTPPIDPADGGRHPLPDPHALGALFARAGIGPDTFVLAYDDGSGWAARCWWLLRHLGHDEAGTFDVRAYEGPLTTEEPRLERAPFVARVREDDLVVYCGSGVSAAPVVQRLVLAGRDDVRLYPGSFSEWCRDPSNPIERGPAT